jgi:hypothetical protein
MFDRQKTETVKRQEAARELGKSAGKHGASERLVNSLRDKHCLSDDEREEFDKGLKEGKG